MQKFNISFHYEESGHCVVEARSEEEAKHILTARLAEQGTDDLKFDCQNRDYSAHDATEITSGLSADIEYGEFVPDEEFFGDGKWDMGLFFFDMDTDPGTPYAEAEITVIAGNEEEAKDSAKGIAYTMEEAKQSDSLSVEVYLA